MRNFQLLLSNDSHLPSRMFSDRNYQQRASQGREDCAHLRAFGESSHPYAERGYLSTTMADDLAAFGAEGAKGSAGRLS